MPAATRELLTPKRIAVNGRPIRLRWLQQIIWSFLAANVGTLIMVALYYLLVQLRWHAGGHTFLYLKPDWDHLFSFRGWAADRHDFRNVYEAILATLFVKSLLANWRKHDRRAPAWYVLLSPILIVVVAFPIVAAGEANPYRHLPRWPWPPEIRERAAWIMQNDQPVPDRTFNITWAVRTVVVILTALAIYGAYVRYVIAKGHG